MIHPFNLTLQEICIGHLFNYLITIVPFSHIISQSKNYNNKPLHFVSTHKLDFNQSHSIINKRRSYKRSTNQQSICNVFKGPCKINTDIQKSYLSQINGSEPNYFNNGQRLKWITIIPFLLSTQIRALRALPETKQKFYLLRILYFNWMGGISMAKQLQSKCNASQKR